MITATQEYIITSVEDERLFLAIDIGTACQSIDVKFIHVPVITDYTRTKWKLVGQHKIQLYEQPDVYVAVADVKDEKEGGVFLTNVGNHLTDPTEWTYDIVQVGNSESYQIKADNGVFTSNGFMNQVTIDRDIGKASQRWRFHPITSGQYNSYEPYGNFFQQDTLDADEDGVGCVYPRFGLKLQYQWESFWASIADLNMADQSADYKVFFLERHGEAFNNVHPHKALESEMRDPQLALEGFLQAQHVQSVWASELAAGIGLPQLSYCSPLTRTLATNTITFGNLLGASSLKTTIVENCREQVTQDKVEHRRPAEYIKEFLPSAKDKKVLPSPCIVFEANFAEYDPYWVHKSGSNDDSNDKPATTNPESDQAFRKRIQGVLDEIFEQHKDKTFVHITTHAGWIKMFCRILGRHPYGTVNAVVLPIVVKANYT